MEPDLGSWQSPDISRSHLYRGTIAWTPPTAIYRAYTVSAYHHDTNKTTYLQCWINNASVMAVPANCPRTSNKHQLQFLTLPEWWWVVGGGCGWWWWRGSSYSYSYSSTNTRYTCYNQVLILAHITSTCTRKFIWFSSQTYNHGTVIL